MLRVMIVGSFQFELLHVPKVELIKIAMYQQMQTSEKKLSGNY